MRKYDCIWLCIVISCLVTACHGKGSVPSNEDISQLALKKGSVISCGPTDAQFGYVDFSMTCDKKLQKDFNVAVELLHSFEYDESEKVFSKIIDAEPGCAMAYWGVAMCSFHPLWTPPTEAELKKGSKAIEIAKRIAGTSPREAGFINAIGSFYAGWHNVDHHTRCVNFEQAMQQLHATYADDKEAAIFYALALDAAADPKDKTYARQREAGAILKGLYPGNQNHPGIIHYIIHTYDYPELATLALPEARRYAAIAPSSAHALHMPSHIFTRLGLWDECIQSNLKSVDAAKCYAQSANMQAHWDEELHGLDYLMYGYLQKGNDSLANQQLQYLRSITKVSPVNFKVAYAFAAMPARYYLENRNWKAAASMRAYPVNFNWAAYPWQEAIIHFTRLLGDVHIGSMDSAKYELYALHRLRDTLVKQKDLYKATEVSVQEKAGEAWIAFASKQKESALQLMKAAADIEDSTGKHPVTPGEVLPARELLADMYLAIGRNEEALESYEAVLKKSPNRFNTLFGAGKAANAAGQKEKSVNYFHQLLSIANASHRNDLAIARQLMAKR